MWSLSYLQGLEVVYVHIWLGSAILTLPFPVSGAGWSCWGGMRASRTPCLEKERLGHSICHRWLCPSSDTSFQSLLCFLLDLPCSQMSFDLSSLVRTSDSVLSHTPSSSLWFLFFRMNEGILSYWSKNHICFLSSSPIARQGKEIVMGRKVGSE